MRLAVLALIFLAGCPRSHPLPKHWELSFSFSAGLCQDTETSACTRGWTITESGPITRVDRFRDAPKTTEIPVSAEQRTDIESILRSSRFWDAMTSKHPCGDTMVNDLWVHVTFVDRDSGAKESQNITACDEKDNFAAPLVKLVMID